MGNYGGERGKGNKGKEKMEKRRIKWKQSFVSKKEGWNRVGRDWWGKGQTKIYH